MTKIGRISMYFCLCISPLALTLVTATHAQDQYPILDKVAAKVVQKYQNSLRTVVAEKSEPTATFTGRTEGIQFLKTDPQMRTVFINKVAAPIANKMFACGLIP